MTSERCGRGRSTLTLGFASAGIAFLVGCGSAGTDAEDAAARFYRAVETNEVAAACDLLAPESRREVEQAEHAPCEQALPKVGLPRVDGPVESERFGRQAQVRFGNDTVFLAEYDEGWKVMAAGCTPRGSLPYDCLVAGG